MKKKKNAASVTKKHRLEAWGGGKDPEKNTADGDKEKKRILKEVSGKFKQNQMGEPLLQW